MKVLVNATPLVVGGAVQVAVATIREALRDPAADDWVFAVSTPVARNLQLLTDISAREFHVFPESPAKSWKLRRRLLQIAAECRPEAVFTVFGPTYVNFSAPHLMGCAMPWVTHPSRLAINTLSLRGRMAWMLKSRYHRYWFRKADRWVTETETSRQGMQQRIGIPTQHTAVVSNTCAQVYLEHAARQTQPPDGHQPVRLFTFSAGYPHKSLDMIPAVAAELKSRCPARRFEFVVTLPEEHPIWRQMRQQAANLGVSSSLINQGTVPMADGPALYASCDICFFPTILETFSAVYPESMAMGLPVVTSDVDFARDICQEAAVFFAPRDAAAAARSILDLLDNAPLWQRVVQRGKQVLRQLPTPKQKYENYVSLLERLIAGQDYDHWQPVSPQQRELRQAG